MDDRISIKERIAQIKNGETTREEVQREYYLTEEEMDEECKKAGLYNIDVEESDYPIEVLLENRQTTDIKSLDINEAFRQVDKVMTTYSTNIPIDTPLRTACQYIQAVIDEWGYNRKDKSLKGLEVSASARDMVYSFTMETYASDAPAYLEYTLQV